MPRKKKVIGKRTPVTAEVLNYLQDQDTGSSLDVFLIQGNGKLRAKLWQEYSEDILQDWIAQKPCSRPEHWWTYDAPKDKKLMAGTHWANTYPVQRKKLSGVGCPDFVKTPAYLPRFNKGLPVEWHDYDAAAPPVFESEAAYLQRFNLLKEAEIKYLTKHPALLAPVTIKYE